MAGPASAARRRRLPPRGLPAPPSPTSTDCVPLLRGVQITNLHGADVFLTICHLFLTRVVSFVLEVSNLILIHFAQLPLGPEYGSWRHRGPVRCPWGVHSLPGAGRTAGGRGEGSGAAGVGSSGEAGSWSRGSEGGGLRGGALSRVGAARSSGSAVGAVGSGCQGLDLASPVKTALRLAVGEEHTVGQTQGDLLGDPHTRPGQRRWRPRQGVVKPLPSTCEAGGRSHGEPKAGGRAGAPGPGAHGTGPASGSTAYTAVPTWRSGPPRRPRAAFATGFCPSSHGRCRHAATRALKPGARRPPRPPPRLPRDVRCSKAARRCVRKEVTSETVKVLNTETYDRSMGGGRLPNLPPTRGHSGD